MHYVKVYTSQVYSTFLSGNLLKKILLLNLHKCIHTKITPDFREKCATQVAQNYSI